jgi:hypothetical protein
MRWRAILIVGCLAPLTGCTTLKISGHNLVHEPVQYEDDQKIRRRLRCDAEKLWDDIARENPDRTFSREFHHGFVDGYVDYLDSGGAPIPPLVPPVRYRRSKYLCPEGHALVRDYFAGFKYGAEVGCASGQRQYLTVPVLLPVLKPESPVNIAVTKEPAAQIPPPPLLPSEEAAGRTGPVDDAPAKPPGTPLGLPKPVPERAPQATPVP